MSYVPSHASAVNLAKPDALVFIPASESTSNAATVGNLIPLGTPSTKFGTWSPTITSDVITLPSGYYYYIESSHQIAHPSSFNYGYYLEWSIFDETNTANIGVPALMYATVGADSNNVTRDDAAHALIDCTSSGIDISIKITANNGIQYVNYFPYSGTGAYFGLGRVIIWRLNP
tara:strand:+ start:994 stop:1515 length:522 start_codon:yes stop_codon:yes gene_type:complete